jgi:hypothetical protein
MTLESKFADMKLDDVSTIVDTVKKEGAAKSGLADNITVLAAKCDSNSDDEALAALKTLKTLVDECPEVQAFTKECLGPCKYLFFFERMEFFKRHIKISEILFLVQK